jgi:hypothetical protein
MAGVATWRYLRTTMTPAPNSTPRNQNKATRYRGESRERHAWITDASQAQNRSMIAKMP